MAVAPLRLAVEAMACRWEVVVQAAEPRLARAAGEAAVAEIQRVAALLSPFEPTSEVSGLNARAGTGPVPVTRELALLLQRCGEWWAATGGCFDPTVGPLLRLWGLRGGERAVPTEAALRAVRERVGWGLVRVEPAAGTVELTRPGMALDCGAVGKGYAADRAAAALADEGATGLVHGGTSSVRAVGGPWRVAVAAPSGSTVAVAALADEALGVSSPRGRQVSDGQRTWGHVIDPRRGAPVDGPWLAAVWTESGAAADAWSTALLVDGEALCAARPDLVVVVAWPDRVRRQGRWSDAPTGGVSEGLHG